MQNNLTESDHIRNMLEKISANENAIGEPPLEPPIEDDTDYSEHESVSELMIPMQNQQEKIMSMQQTAQTDPKSAYKEYKENYDEMFAAMPADINAGDDTRSYGEKFDRLADEFQHLDDLPKTAGELRKFLSDAQEFFEKLIELVQEYSYEIGLAAAEAQREEDMRDQGIDSYLSKQDQSW